MFYAERNNNSSNTASQFEFYHLDLSAKQAQVEMPPTSNPTNKQPHQEGALNGRGSDNANPKPHQSDPPFPPPQGECTRSSIAVVCIERRFASAMTVVQAEAALLMGKSPLPGC